MTPIPAYQLPILHLKCYGFQQTTNHEPLQAGLIVTLPELLCRTTERASQNHRVSLCAHPQPGLEPGLQRKTAAWPGSTQVPPRMAEGPEVLSSPPGMFCGHIPYLLFLLPSGKWEHSALYLAHRFALKPNALQHVGNRWLCWL